MNSEEGFADVVRKLTDAENAEYKKEVNRIKRLLTTSLEKNKYDKFKIEFDPNIEDKTKMRILMTLYNTDGLLLALYDDEEDDLNDLTYDGMGGFEALGHTNNWLITLKALLENLVESLTKKNKDGVEKPKDNEEWYDLYVRYVGINPL